MAQPERLCCSPLLTAPLGQDDAEDLALILKALADPVRLQLVSLIAATGEECACDLPGAVGKSQPTVSHHLKQLVEAQILLREQRGKWAWFTVNESRLAEVCAILA